MNKKISRLKTKFLEFRFKANVGGNGSNHSLRIRDQFNNKIKN